MRDLYAETVSLCPECARDSHAWYEETPEGVHLCVECAEHGMSRERVESDPRLFKHMYEQEYQKVTRHLVLPITYHCNLTCKYCYTLSNSPLPLPADRSLERIAGVIRPFDGNITLIGGEPTLREDLLQLIAAAKGMEGHRRISLGTNGQRLKDIQFVHQLKESGLDFVFLSLNDVEYEPSDTVFRNKIAALQNCVKLGMPVWLQRTVDRATQLDSILDLLETYKRVIFNVTIRSIRPFGVLYPQGQVCVSEMLKRFHKEDDFTKGVSPFNCHVRLKGKNTKLCSWVNDMKRLDPIDSNYLISNDVMTTFHRGMKVDEVLIKRKDYMTRHGTAN